MLSFVSQTQLTAQEVGRQQCLRASPVTSTGPQSTGSGAEATHSVRYRLTANSFQRMRFSFGRVVKSVFMSSHSNLMYFPHQMTLRFSHLRSSSSCFVSISICVRLSSSPLSLSSVALFSLAKLIVQSFVANRIRGHSLALPFRASIK